MIFFSVWTLSRLGLAGTLRRVPPDVTLSKRFEQARKNLDTRLRELDDRARAALREHLAPVEKLCEDAIERLEQVRASLNAGDVPRRAFWGARRTARRALREWHAVTRHHLELATASA